MALTAASAPASLDHASVVVFDRTVSCSVAREAGVFQFHVDAGHAGHAENPFPGAVGLRSGEGPGTELAGFDGDRGVFVNAKRCRAVRLRIPLSPRGLPGPPVRFNTEVVCPTRQRLLVRVHAAINPGPRQPGYLVGGHLVAGSLAVRLERTRRPMAFAALADEGRTSRLYTAPRCTNSQ